MVHGKIWSIEDEAELRRLVASGLGVAEISEELDRSRGSVKSKLSDLDLHLQRGVSVDGGAEVGVDGALESPHDLPSLKEALHVHDGARRALERPGLTKVEILRVQALMRWAKDYSKMFPVFARYKALEIKVKELSRELEEQKKRNQKGT